MQRDDVLSPIPATESGVAREELHFRRIDMRGYRRSDGLYEVEGRVTDVKPRDFAPGADTTWACASYLTSTWSFRRSRHSWTPRPSRYASVAARRCRR